MLTIYLDYCCYLCYAQDFDKDSLLSMIFEFMKISYT